MELRDFAVLDETLLREIGRLRVAAWETETSRAAEMDIWLDEFDRSARHWVVFCEGMPVAAARLSVHASLAEVPDAESYADVFTQPPPAPIASLNRSKRLDRIRLDAAEAMGCRSAILSTASGPRRIRQLLGWGFELAGYGPRFEKPPLCYLPAPAVLLCRLPRTNANRRTQSSLALKAA